MSYDIALLPGDGIGPELYEETMPLVTTLARKHDVDIETTWYDWNSSRYLEHHEMMPPDGPDRLSRHDAILHGAMGHPEVPDHVSSGEGHLRIRREFDHYVNLRPAVLFEGVSSPLSGYASTDIDIAWFRENSEGGYLNIGGALTREGTSELAVQSTVFTRTGTERIAREAFEAATTRTGHVTNVTKSNAQKHAPVFWDDVIEAVSTEFPGVTLDHMYVDAAALHLVQRPEAFDVVVAPNLFSDILTDLTAAVVGGLGVAPSANYNPFNDKPGMFEPVHGSAPDIAGEGIANPVATLLSIAMMFEDLDESTLASDLEDAVRATLADPDAPRTPDLGGSDGTDAMVADIGERLQNER